MNSTTGESTIIATGLDNPNGVSFGPGYHTIYVGSFGGGTVTAIDRDADGNFGTPYNYITLPGSGAPPDPLNICKGNDVGGWCYTVSGLGGQCQAGVGGKLECQADPQNSDPLVEICADHNVNDTCGLIISSKTYSGRCKLAAGHLACDIHTTASQPCFHQLAGKACVAFPSGLPSYGVCIDHGPQGLLCDPPDDTGFGGGLDGLNVDECGTVYVTEYIAGIVWRKVPGHAVEQAVQLPSQWIPNMKWGNGIGGWDDHVLYVADRDENRMFGLRIGRRGKHTTVVWP